MGTLIKMIQEFPQMVMDRPVVAALYVGGVLVIAGACGIVFRGQES